MNRSFIVMFFATHSSLERAEKLVVLASFSSHFNHLKYQLFLILKISFVHVENTVIV